MGSLTDILKQIKDFAESEKPVDYIVIATNETKAEFQNRVFNSEEGAKDTKGKGLGKYSNPYAKYRRSKGRQSAVVDLEFTGSLRRDIRVVKNDNVIQMAFTSDKETKKRGYLEEMYKTNIFSLNEEEYEKLTDKASNLILTEIEEIFNNG